MLSYDVTLKLIPNDSKGPNIASDLKAIIYSIKQYKLNVFLRKRYQVVNQTHSSMTAELNKARLGYLILLPLNKLNIATHFIISEYCANVLENVANCS